MPGKIKVPEVIVEEVKKIAEAEGKTPEEVVQ